MMQKSEQLMDRLPEITSYQDSGCDIHPSCLACPLSQCRYDDPGWIQREERGQRDVEMLKLRVTEALPVPELASRFGVSTRTVHRALRKTETDLNVLVKAGQVSLVL
ncbi:GntR family transcriptional regulator [Dehalococcoidia bacterium]|nr:GntR family transcriptional regulator [Dehalococcoidia bacterium]